MTRSERFLKSVQKDEVQDDENVKIEHGGLGKRTGRQAKGEQKDCRNTRYKEGDKHSRSSAGRRDRDEYRAERRAEGDEKVEHEVQEDRRSISIQ